MVKRIAVYVLGVLILGLGLVLNTKTQLGVSAIISVPYVFTELFGFTLGNWTTALYVVFVIMQCIIFKKVRLSVILQIPLSFAMGLLIDFYNSIITVVPSSLAESLVLLFVAILLTALGAYLTVGMQIIANPADGAVDALAGLFGKSFGNMKLLFDCSMMVITIVISLCFLHRLAGIGIGTVIAAFAVGKCIVLYAGKLDPVLRKIVEDSRNSDKKARDNHE